MPYNLGVINDQRAEKGLSRLTDEQAQVIVAGVSDPTNTLLNIVWDRIPVDTDMDISAALAEHDEPAAKPAPRKKKPKAE